MAVGNPVLYLPVESQNRELDAKLLIGATVAAAGLKVVIGWQHAIVTNLSHLPPGLLLLKGLNKIQRLHMERARQAGHMVFAIDEECFSISDPECMLKDIDPRVAENCQRVYAPNAVYQKVLVENRGFREDQVVVVGNPRGELARAPFAEMLRPEADALAEKFGPLVLVNSNTCAVNSIWGDLETYFKICAEIGWLDPRNPGGRKTFHDHVEHDQACFVALREALELLAADLPNHNIVIRPHPSERFEPWHERYADRERFHVVREGGNLAWIMASDLLLHTSCTTGAEAALMERPTISLVPEGACVSHWYVSNRVNLTARTAVDIADLSRRFLVGGEDVFEPGRQDRDRALQEYFSLDPDRSSHDRIAADILETLDGPVDRNYHWKIERLDVTQESVAESNKNNFDLAKINERLDLLARVSSSFEIPSARRIHDELFMLERGS